MSTTKVSELTELSTAADNDVLLITDTSENASKKITKSNLISGLATTTYVDTQVATKDALSELSGTSDDITEGSTNLFLTSAEQTKLSGIEASADVTDATNVDAAGAVMNTDTTTASMSFVVDEDTMTSNSATKVPTQQSVKAYVDAEVAGVVNSAPAALDTLNELAAALGDDANFATTTATSLGEKLVKASNLSDLTDAATARTNLGLGTAATSASTDFVATTGDDMTGDLNFGDNNKAQFGASNDLQIYHTGSDSFVDDAGTGSLYIRSNSVVLGKYTGEVGLVATADGSTDLYYNDAKKLETTSGGIDVTGTITCDNTISISDGTTNGFIQTSGGLQVGCSSNHAIDFYVNNSNRFRMETDGDFHADGDVIAYSTTVSDRNLKKDIKPIEDALSKVNKLNGCTFTYTSDNVESAGLIAQEVEEVLPSAVRTKSLVFHGEKGKEYKTLQYDQTIGLLVEAIKELTAKVEELENK